MAVGTPSPLALKNVPMGEAVKPLPDFCATNVTNP
jgi:hypothetical protein